MFDKKIIIVTPWFERFAGGAEQLARGMAREFNKRGLPAMVFTTCSLSPYDSWWEDHYQPGVYDVAGIETRRFATVKGRAGMMRSWVSCGAAVIWRPVMSRTFSTMASIAMIWLRPG